MEITNSLVENYIEGLLDDRKPIFFKLEKYAEGIDFPIIGPLVGQMLKVYTSIIKAKSIIELGSGFGYSALWFAEGLGEKGRIICTDFLEKNGTFAQKNFLEAGVENAIDFRIGDGLKILEKSEEKYDIIFNDVEKEDYPRVFDIAIPKLNSGGLLITDNTLWYGKVVDRKDQSKATKGVREYNRKAFADIRVQSIIIPLRDGITLSFKL